MYKFSQVCALRLHDTGAWLQQWSADIPAIVACVIVAAVTSQAQGNELVGPGGASLEIQIAELKAKAAELVALERARLDALTSQQRLVAPPVIWRVRDALSEFRD